MTSDLPIRLTAFEWLSKQSLIYNDVIPRETLQQGFEFNNQRIPLISPQGIFKPKAMQFPLSITTSPESPYDDKMDESGILKYRYRGTDPDHRDNIGLREAYKRKLPLVYLVGLTPGKYMAIWPVYIVSDDPQNLCFNLVVEDRTEIQKREDYSFQIGDSAAGRRAYMTSIIKVRLHQRTFRERVLDAYLSQCSLCRLKHRELLDAAHIIPDEHPKGEPVISNGISLCKLHHAAFDNLFIGITPDFKIEVRKDILEEEDGPMLQHGLKGLHGNKIILPVHKNDWPDKNHLDWRYNEFLKAG